MLCHVMSCYVMLCYGLGADPCFTMAPVLRYVNVMSCHVMLCYVMLCYVTLCYVMLRYVRLRYVMLSMRAMAAGRSRRTRPHA